MRLQGRVRGVPSSPEDVVEVVKAVIKLATLVDELAGAMKGELVPEAMKRNLAFLQQSSLQVVEEAAKGVGVWGSAKWDPRDVSAQMAEGQALGVLVCGLARRSGLEWLLAAMSAKGGLRRAVTVVVPTFEVPAPPRLETRKQAVSRIVRSLEATGFKVVEVYYLDDRTYGGQIAGGRACVFVASTSASAAKCRGDGLKTAVLPDAFLRCIDPECLVRYVRDGGILGMKAYVAMESLCPEGCVVKEVSLHDAERLSAKGLFGLGPCVIDHLRVSEWFKAALLEGRRCCFFEEDRQDCFGQNDETHAAMVSGAICVRRAGGERVIAIMDSGWPDVCGDGGCPAAYVGVEVKLAAELQATLVHFEGKATAPPPIGGQGIVPKYWTAGHLDAVPRVESAAAVSLPVGCVCSVLPKSTALGSSSIGGESLDSSAQWRDAIAPSLAEEAVSRILIAAEPGVEAGCFTGCPDEDDEASLVAPKASSQVERAATWAGVGEVVGPDRPHLTLYGGVPMVCGEFWTSLQGRKEDA
jgi:hypothetical protein